MSNLDLLERAHARLTELRDAAEPGPWKVETRAYSDEVHDYSASFIPGVAPEITTEHEGDTAPLGTSDAALIVTLHRTIDAQLAMLQTQIKYAEWDPSLKPSAIDEPAYFADALVLARAILGEAE